MGSAGTNWDSGDVLTAARLNQKTKTVDTGANINADTTYVGLQAQPTSTNGSLVAGNLYQRNNADSAWLETPMLSGITHAAGDLIKDDGTSWARWAKGTAFQIPRVNSGATDLEWKDLIYAELGRDTADAADTSLTSGTITAKKYLKVIANIKTQTSSSVWGITFNNDTTATNYHTRASANQGAVGGDANDNSMLESIASGATAQIIIEIQNNAAGDEKSAKFSVIETTTTAPPDTREGYMMWHNSAAQITRVDIVRISGTGTLTTAAFMAVFGGS